MGIHINGVDELIEKLARIDKLEIVRAYLRAAAEYLKGKFATYPQQGRLTRTEVYGLFPRGRDRPHGKNSVDTSVPSLDRIQPRPFGKEPSTEARQVHAQGTAHPPTLHPGCRLGRRCVSLAPV